MKRPMNQSDQGQRGTTKKGEPIMYDIENKINFAVFPGKMSRMPSLHALHATGGR